MQFTGKTSRRISSVLIAVALTAGTVLVFSGAARAADDAPNPIVTQVKAAVPDPAKPFILGVILKAKDGEEAKVEAAFAKAVTAFRAEKGCAVYEFSRAADSPTTYVVYERWQDTPSLENHVKGEAFRALVTDLDGILQAEPDIKVLVPLSQ